MDKHEAGPKIRQSISDGRLPTHRPPRTWFGFAQGDTSCAACGDRIAMRDLECEAEFPDESRTWLFHAACFEIWEAERVDALTCAPDGHPVDGQPPVTKNGGPPPVARIADSPRDGSSRLSRARWPVRVFQDLSGGIRRSARDVISLIAPRRRARPR
jgi:hypothetical protein